MVLAGTIVESKYPTSAPFKIKIKQKAGRIQEEQSRSRSSIGCFLVSRGEFTRNNSTTCEGTTSTKKRTSILESRAHSRESSPRRSISGETRRPSPVQGRRGLKDCNQKDVNPKTSLRNGRFQSISKSASVPTNLTGKSNSHTPQEGILKRSSSFLASLTSSSRRSSLDRRRSPEGRNNHNSSFVKGKSCNSEEESRTLTTVLRKRPTSLFISRSRDKSPEDHRGFPGKDFVKKCVSFSSDTTFSESRPSLKKSAVHESKVYRKGVLQDRNSSEIYEANLPPAWDPPLGGPKALIRAAREGDDDVLKRLITRAQKAGLGDVDVNAADDSGRTAISYMAGNGSATLLETVLAFSGIDPNLPDNEQNTPLHFAAQAGQTECLNILLQRCPTIEVDVRNALGFTPLMKAALQGRTKCAKILLFAGANPTLRDHGRGLRAEQWARFCGRYVCAEVIERFARHRLLEKTTSCRWGSEPELAAKVLQGKLAPTTPCPLPPPTMGLKSRIRRVFRTTSGPDRSFSLVTQLTTAALCASSPALPKPGEMPATVKNLLRPLSVPQLRITLVSSQEILDRTNDKCHGTSFTEKIESTIAKPPRQKKKSK